MESDNNGNQIIDAEKDVTNSEIKKKKRAYR